MIVLRAENNFISLTVSTYELGSDYVRKSQAPNFNPVILHFLICRFDNLLAIQHSVSLAEEEFLWLRISHGGFHSTAWSTAGDCWFMGQCVGAYEVGAGKELRSAALGSSAELHPQFGRRFLAVGRARPALGLSYLLG